MQPISATVAILAAISFIAMSLGSYTSSASIRTCTRGNLDISEWLAGEWSRRHFPQGHQPLARIAQRLIRFASRTGCFFGGNNFVEIWSRDDLDLLQMRRRFRALLFAHQR